MAKDQMADLVRRRLTKASRALSVSDPNQYLGSLLERTFWLPVGDPKYATNALSPGAAPCESRFSETNPHDLHILIEPLTPGTSPVSRRDEATREMRRLVEPRFGREALNWFDERSEEWRGFGAPARLKYGAWLGTSYDHEGLSASTVYYELLPHQVHALPRELAHVVHAVQELIPRLVPVFTAISCSQEHGGQRVTFLHDAPLRLVELEPLMGRLGMAHQLPSIMRIIGLVLGGRFDLPPRSVLLGVQLAGGHIELDLEVLLGAIPDIPPSFLDLLALGLAERPRELRALARWLGAFTPESGEWPGAISALRIRATQHSPARVSLDLRPVEFEINGRHRSERHEMERVG